MLPETRQSCPKVTHTNGGTTVTARRVVRRSLLAGLLAIPAALAVQQAAPHAAVKPAARSVIETGGFIDVTLTHTFSHVESGSDVEIIANGTASVHYRANLSATSFQLQNGFSDSFAQVGPPTLIDSSGSLTGSYTRHYDFNCLASETTGSVDTVLPGQPVTVTAAPPNTGGVDPHFTVINPAAGVDRLVNISGGTPSLRIGGPLVIANQVGPCQLLESAGSWAGLSMFYGGPLPILVTPDSQGVYSCRPGPLPPSPDYTVTFTVSCNLRSNAGPSINGTPPDGTVGQPYNYPFAITGLGAFPLPIPDITVTGGQLPPGLTLNVRGTLSGIPTTAGEYNFTVRAFNGNWWSVDTTPVTIRIFEPLLATIVTPTPDQSFAGRPVVITGTASGGGAPVTAVGVVVWRPTGQYWNGSGWQDGPTAVSASLATPGATSTGWSYSFNPPESGGRFYVTAVTTIPPGFSPYTPWVPFSLPDSQAPGARIDTPQDGGSTEGELLISGFASDNNLIAGVGVSIWRANSGGEFWNGESWQSTFAYIPATVQSLGGPNTNWSLTFLPPSSGDYYIAALPYDSTYNYILTGFIRVNHVIGVGGARR
jgi:hypothetical protein